MSVETSTTYATAFSYSESRGSAASRCFSISLDTKSSAPLMFSVLEGFSANLSGQIAVKMAGDKIVERGLDVAHLSKNLTSSEIVRESLKAANTEVYDYGRKMKAGGTVSSKALLAAVYENKITIGRLGNYDCVLRREGEVMRFFEDATASSASDLTSLGSSPRIMVDLASVELSSGDLVILSTAEHGDKFYSLMLEVLERESDIKTIVDALLAIYNSDNLKSKTDLSFKCSSFFALKIS